MKSDVDSFTVETVGNALKIINPFEALGPDDIRSHDYGETLGPAGKSYLYNAAAKTLRENTEGIEGGAQNPHCETR